MKTDNSIANTMVNNSQQWSIVICVWIASSCALCLVCWTVYYCVSPAHLIQCLYNTQLLYNTPKLVCYSHMTYLEHTVELLDKPWIVIRYDRLLHVEHAQQLPAHSAQYKTDTAATRGRTCIRVITIIYHIISYHLYVSFRFVWLQTHIISYHFMSYHIVSYHMYVSFRHVCSPYQHLLEEFIFF